MATSAPQGRIPYHPGYAHTAHHEIRTASNSAPHLLPVLAVKYKSNPKLTFLDVGAGSGTITADLASRIPEGHVTALDLEQRILDKAASYAEGKGVKNITFRTGSVYQLPFPDDKFDVVHAHQVLVHLDAPVDAMKELVRVAKPGGVVASREGDLRSFCIHPNTPALEKWNRLILESHTAGGGAVDAGVRLLSWALQVGMPREKVVMGTGTWCYCEEGERRVWAKSMADRLRTGELGEALLSMGLAARAELEEMATAWEEWAKDPSAVIGSLHGELLIHK